MISGTFNIINVGSSVKSVEYNGKVIFITRPYIDIPNTNIKKWGNEYISFRNISPETIEKILENDGEFVSMYGEMKKDKNECKYLRMSGCVAKTNKPDYWILTFGCQDSIARRNSLIKHNEDSISQIFSIAFNNSNPILFEAMAILQPLDVIKVGNFHQVFNPNDRPFLKVVVPE